MENLSLSYPNISSPPVTHTPAGSTVKVYFKNLDGIRSIAALLVVLQHLSDYKNDAKLFGVNSERSVVSSLGLYGVTLFFVLSGFLIFYLLFTEKKITGTINVKDFYIRRMLRIWPLYFGFGIISIVGIDALFSLMGVTLHTPVGENMFYLFTFSVNIQMVFCMLNRGVIELYWSVCIEEQFYLFAPWLVKKGKRIGFIIISLIAIGILSKFLLAYLQSNKLVSFDKELNPLAFFTTCWFDAFGFGILAAYLYFNKELFEKIRPFIQSKWLQGLTTLFVLLYITNFIPKPSLVSNYLFSTVPAILFAYLILAAATGSFIFNLEKPLLRRIGKYSYGIYIFHSAVAQISLYFFLRFFAKENFLAFEILYPVATILLVILISGLSYELYEKRFLKIKKKFTLIQNQKP